MSDVVETPVAEAATPSTPPVTAAPQPVVKSAEPDPSDYLSRIQANAEKFARGESTSVEAPSTPEASSETPASDTLDPLEAAKAYEGKEEAKPEEKPEPKEEPKAEAPKEEAKAPEGEQKPVEARDGESLRQVIKRSNLPPELKETITNLAFKADAYEKIGFSVEQARQLKDLGITPEVVAERVSLHPSVEDERRDAQLAIGMRKLGADLTEDPGRFVDGIANANPEMAQNLIAAAVERAEYVAPDLLIDKHEKAIWRALNEAYQDPDNADETRLEAIRNVAALFFPDGPPEQAPTYGQPESDLSRSADPIHREYARLQQEKAAFEAQQRSSFASAMFNSGKQAVLETTKAAWNEVRPKSMPEKVSDRIVSDIFEKVGAALLSNEAIKRDMEGFLTGPLDQEQFNRAVGWLLDRAKPIILTKRKAALDEWGDVFNGFSSPQPAPSAKPAPAAPAKPDVGRASSAPGPSAPVDVKAQVMAEMKQKGWSYFEAMQEYGRRTAARR